MSDQMKHTSEYVKSLVSVGRVSVHLHGWRLLDDGGQEYTDEKPDGYSTYCRIETPDDPQQPFDIRNEQDHAQLQSAVGVAQQMALYLFNDRDDWNHD